jgi:hypothetical protein
MTFAAKLDIAALAAQAAGCGFDCDITPWWQDVLAFLVAGAIPLPIAFTFVWALHRAKLDRWVLLNAPVVAVASLLASAVPELFGLSLYAGVFDVAEDLGLRFSYDILLPALSVSFLGSAAAGWWLKREAQKPSVEAFE